MAWRREPVLDIASLVGDCIGSTKAVLFAGRWNAALAERLRNADCTLNFLSLDRDAANAAASFCSAVATIDVEAWSFPESMSSVRYDAIVLEGLLEICPDKEAMLAEMMSAIANGGIVAAVLPHTAHGAIRYALMTGTQTEAFAGVASAREAVEPFERCGFHIRKVHRILSPIFGSHEASNLTSSPDADSTLVHELQMDPEAETSAFVVIADTAPLESSSDAGLQSEIYRGPEGDRFAVDFETAADAQRRRAQLEEDLRAALSEVDRLRGRVIALEDALREHARDLKVSKPKKK